MELPHPPLIQSDRIRITSEVSGSDPMWSYWIRIQYGVALSDLDLIRSYRLRLPLLVTGSGYDPKSLDQDPIQRLPELDPIRSFWSSSKVTESVSTSEFLSSELKFQPAARAWASIHYFPASELGASSKFFQHRSVIVVAIQIICHRVMRLKLLQIKSKFAFVNLYISYLSDRVRIVRRYLLSTLKLY